MSSSRAPGLSGRRVLVTGAAGFLGWHLVRRLLQEGAEVTGLVRPGSAGLDAHAGESGLSRLEASLEDRDVLREAVHRARPEYVFHLAGRVDLTHAPDVTEACVRENILATTNLCWALEGLPVRSLVAASTIDVYGRNRAPYDEEQPVDPGTPYAVSKVAAEMFCRHFAARHSVPTVILRLAAMYGPRQGERRLVPSVVLAVLRGSPLDMTLGEHRRDLLFVGDAVDGLVRAALSSAARGQTINLGTNQPISLRETVEIICRLMETSWRPRFGGLPERLNEPDVMSCRWEWAARLLEWRPSTPLEEGLRVTIDAYRAVSASPVP